MIVDDKLRFHELFRNTVNKASSLADNLLPGTMRWGLEFMKALFITHFTAILD